MILESLLASAHLLALLTLIVFQSSQAALCRPEWFNAAVLARLGVLDRIVALAGLALILTGLLRLGWGIKPLAAYLGQPMFHLKMVLIATLLFLAWRPSSAIRRWRRDEAATGELPPPFEIRRVRAMIMAAAHLVPVVAVVAVFWARGY